VPLCVLSFSPSTTTKAPIFGKEEQQNVDEKDEGTHNGIKASILSGFLQVDIKVILQGVGIMKRSEIER